MALTSAASLCHEHVLGAIIWVFCFVQSLCKLLIHPRSLGRSHQIKPSVLEGSVCGTRNFHETLCSSACHNLPKESHLMPWACQIKAGTRKGHERLRETEEREVEGFASSANSFGTSTGISVTYEPSQTVENHLLRDTARQGMCF